jgi:hypothetical protein
MLSDPGHNPGVPENNPSCIKGRSLVRGFKYAPVYISQNFMGVSALLLPRFSAWLQRIEAGYLRGLLEPWSYFLTNDHR